MLIERGAVIEKRNKKQETALMWGSFSGYEAVVQTLIDSGANINSTNVDGNSALTLTVATGERIQNEKKEDSTR